MTSRTLARRITIGAILLGALVGLTACLPVPLGDPAKSTADSRLFGVWEWRDAHVNTVIIRPWDQHTYVIDALTADVSGDKGETLTPKSRDVFKGWLTEVKGQTFLTMQPIDTIGTVNGDDRRPYYIVARVKLDGAALTAAAVDPQFKAVKDVTTSAQLKRALAANLDDPKLFLPPTVATRWTAEQMKGLEKLQDTFRNFKQP